MATTRMDEISASQFDLCMHIAEINEAITCAKTLIADFRLKMAIAKSNLDVEMLDFACDHALAASKKLMQLYEMKEHSMEEIRKNNVMLEEIRDLYEHFEKEV